MEEKRKIFIDCQETQTASIVRRKTTFGKICSCMVGKVGFRDRHRTNLVSQSFFLEISTCVWANGEGAEYLGWAEIRMTVHGWCE